jgi:hypothetical protein
MNHTPPFIVSIPPECAFYHTVEEAAAACGSGVVDVYDAHGLRLSKSVNGFEVSSVEPDELAHVLRRWLGHTDALRESTVSWPLWLLVHAAVEHAGYAG